MIDMPAATIAANIPVVSFPIVALTRTHARSHTNRERRPRATQEDSFYFCLVESRHYDCNSF